MELLQNGCNMSILSMICNNTSKGILNTLQFVLIETRQTSKQRVTVVQMTTNQGICSKDCHFWSNILSYSTKVTHLKKAHFASLSPLDMFREGNSVSNHTPRFLTESTGQRRLPRTLTGKWEEIF